MSSLSTQLTAHQHLLCDRTCRPHTPESINLLKLPRLRRPKLEDSPIPVVQAHRLVNRPDALHRPSTTSPLEAIYISGLGVFENTLLETASRTYKLSGVGYTIRSLRCIPRRSDGSALSYEDWLEDVRSIVQGVIHRGKTPLLVGLSTGAFVAASIASEFPDTTAGLCMIAPPFKLVSWKQRALLRIIDVLERNSTPLGRLIKTWHVKATPYCKAHSTEPMRSDPFYEKVPAIACIAMRRVRARAIEGISKLRCPIFFAQGIEDLTSNPRATIEHAERIRHTEVNIRLYHSPHNIPLGPARHAFIKDLTEWTTRLPLKVRQEGGETSSRAEVLARMVRAVHFKSLGEMNAEAR